MSEELKPVTDHGVGFDADEPNVRGIIILTAATVILFIAVLVGVTYYYNHAYEQQEYLQLLARPSEELKEVRAREDWNLTHYGYLDKANGQVRIPVDRAMALLVKEAAEGKLKYPVNDQAPKKPEPAPAAPGTQPTAPVPAGK